MLAIRMQRTGRKGHAMFRIIVQDSRRTPTSGNLVALLGNYDPHTKTTTLTKGKAQFYLDHGAQPSPIVIRILKQEGIKLPKWTQASTKKKSAIRNPEKLRRNRPAGEVKAEPVVTESPAQSEEVTQDTKPEATETEVDEVVADQETTTPVETETDKEPIEEETPVKADETTPPVKTK